MNPVGCFIELASLCKCGSDLNIVKCALIVQHYSSGVFLLSNIQQGVRFQVIVSALAMPATV